jgi:hypothetical protein
VALASREAASAPGGTRVRPRAVDLEPANLEQADVEQDQAPPGAQVARECVFLGARARIFMIPNDL